MNTKSKKRGLELDFLCVQTSATGEDASEGRSSEGNKRQKRSVNRRDMIRGITEFLALAQSDFDFAQDKWEIEVRLGLLTVHGNRVQSSHGGHEFRHPKAINAEFQPGVTPKFFENLKRTLDETPSMTVTHTNTEYYLYKDKRRIHKEKETGRIIGQDEKRSLEKTNCLMPMCAYDFRVAIAEETPLDIPDEVSEQWTSMRRKERWSYSDSEDPTWILDLTKVQTVTPPDHNETDVEFEVEIELSDHDLIATRDSSKIEVVAESLWNRLDSILKPATSTQAVSRSTGPVQGIPTKKVDNHRLCQNLRAAVLTLPHDDLWRSDRFPGSLPVAFKRQNIPDVQNHDYLISEKTDGVRYFLVVAQDGVFFVDRNFVFHAVEGFASLIDIYGVGTVIDGEVIEYQGEPKRPMFMVFDLLGVRGVSCCHLALSGRLQKIGTDIIAPYRKAVEDGTIPKQHPFTIIGKQFFPRQKIRDLFAKIVEGPNGVRHYRDPKRYHRTDGIVIAPNTPYTYGTAYNLFKWKWADKVSIDFKFDFNNGYIDRVCCGSQAGPVPFRVDFPSSEIDRLLKDWGQRSGEIVVECGYDTSKGMWTYHGLRRDKKKANFIDTVVDTFLQLAENIRPEELRYRLALDGPHRDDWMQRVNSALEKIGGAGGPSSSQQRPPADSSRPAQHGNSGGVSKAPVWQYGGARRPSDG